VVRSVATRITPQRATSTASFTSNFADLCRGSYATQLLLLSRAQIPILYGTDRQQIAITMRIADTWDNGEASGVNHLLQQSPAF
jgi:hypothetical protein